MLKPQKGRRIHTFATSHARASAIETVAGQYKEELEVSVEPIDTPEKASNAARRSFQEIETTGAGGYNRDLDEIIARYERLGATGAASMVQLGVAKDGGFDFVTFHQEVDDILGPENAQPRVM